MTLHRAIVEGAAHSSSKWPKRKCLPTLWTFQIFLLILLNWVAPFSSAGTFFNIAFVYGDVHCWHCLIKSRGSLWAAQRLFTGLNAASEPQSFLLLPLRLWCSTVTLYRLASIPSLAFIKKDHMRSAPLTLLFLSFFFLPWIPLLGSLLLNPTLQRVLKLVSLSSLVPSGAWVWSPRGEWVLIASGHVMTAPCLFASAPQS